MRLRPPRSDESRAVFEVLLARDMADLGFPDFTLADLEEEWTRRDFELSRDAVVCEDGDGAIVGYAAVRRTHGLAVVAPDHERGGVGTQLLEWLERRERELGRTHHRQGIVGGNARAEELFARRGYCYERSYWRMARSLEQLPAGAAVEGLQLRELDPARDAAAVYQLDAESFVDNADYVPMSFEAFRDEHLDAHDVVPELSVIAERAGEIVGFLIARVLSEEGSGHVDVLAVAPSEQGRGIGSALLLGGFGGFAEAGLNEATLGVASSNPRALALYERLGMSPRFRMDTYVRPARERG